MTAPIWITNSGRLTEVEEGSVLSATIQFTSGSLASVEILSGELPPGATLNYVSDTQYSITGSISAIPTETEYFFTIRATNSDGSSERGFSVLVTQITPVWLTPTRLATVSELDTVEHQFQLADPGGTATFVKISGTLPPGIGINSSGLLKGRVGEVSEDTLYSFVMRATSSEGTVIDKTFEISVLNAEENRSPIWLTSAGELGIINNGETSSLSVNAFDPDGDPLTFSLVSGSLPDGLSLNTTTGAISGTCSTVVQGSWPFSVRVSDGTFTKLRNFTILTNENFDASIAWVTEAGNIGSLSIGENSLLQLVAQSDYPIRFSISSGELPQGLQLHPSNGAIYDDVQFQSTGEYTFTVLAENNFVQSFRQFSITVTSGYAARAIRAYLQVPYQFISEYREIIEGQTYSQSDLFRPYDDRYGVQEFPKILIFENMKTATPMEFKVRYEDVMTPLTVIIGDLKIGYARDENGFILYELIYQEVLESTPDALVSFVSPQTQVTIQPASFANFRENFTNTFPGISGPTETLPAWMTSPQVANDSSTIPGFTAALPILYCNPGTAEQIVADLLDDEDFGNRLKGEEIIFTGIGFETSVDDDLPQDFFVRFHSLIQTQERQEDLASNAPVWITLPGSLGDFDNGDVVSISVQANDPNLLPRTYSIATGTLPSGLFMASNGIISGTIDTTASQYWPIVISADSSSGFSRTRGFIIGTNI